MNVRKIFACVSVVALSAFPLFGAGLEYEPSEMYTLAPDGARMPLAPDRVNKEGFVLPRPDSAVHVELKGIEPGEYHLSTRSLFNIPMEHVENFIRISEMFVNGVRVRYIRACVPEEGDRVEWLEHDKVALKDGDVVTLLTNKGDAPVSQLRLTKERLPGDIIRRCDEPSNRETFIADLSTSALAPDQLTVRLVNKVGKPTAGELSVLVKDFWGNVILEKTEKLTLAGTLERAFAFAPNASGETRATVVWKRGDGVFERKFLSASHDVLAGLRKRVMFDDGWSSCCREDDGSYDSRRFRDDVPSYAKAKEGGWKATPLPSVISKGPTGKRVTTAYYKKTFTVPAAFRGSRVVFHAERTRNRARLFVNGKFVREQADDELALAFLADITDFLKDGENEILVAIHGHADAFREDDLKTVKNLDRSLEYMPARSKVSFCEVTLEARPAIALVKRPFIVTSVSNMTITVRTDDVPAGCTVSHRVLYKNKVLLKNLKDGVQTPFKDAPLWGLTSFPLLQLETTLVRDGKVLDRLSTRFGFREFSTRGNDFLWNGRPYRGISRAMGGFNCLDRETNGSRQRLLDGIDIMLKGGERFITHTDQPHILYDFCDECGVPAKFEMPYGAAGQMEARFLDNPRFWAAKKAAAHRAVDTYGHHPSIFCYPVCGEFWVLNDDRAYERIAPCIRALQAYDPTRFVEAESDGDARGLTGISSTHYPLPGCSRGMEYWYPNQFYWRPLDGVYTNGMAIPYGQVKTIGNCHGDSLLSYNTKPIFANETGWVVNIARPHGTTRFFGDESYCGFNTMELHHYFVNFETYVGQREIGMTHIGNWRAMGSDRVSDIAPLFDVQPVERYHAFYEGTDVSFQVNVFHDILKAETLDFTWTLAGANGKAVASGKDPLFFDWCKGAKTLIRFKAPKEGRYTLRFGVEGRLMRELPVESYARKGDEAKLLADARIVAGDKPVTPEMLAKVEKGATLFLLPRKEYPEELPVRLSVTERNASLSMTFRPEHPLLKGLAESDLSLWYPDHVCGRGYFSKPTSGLAKTVIEAGGPKGLDYSALVEIPYGKGVVYATRLELDPTVNPIAAKILRNVAALKPAKPLRKLGVIGGTYLKQLKAWGVDVEQIKAEDLAARQHEFAALFVDGNDKSAAKLLSSISASTSSLHLIFVQNPDPKLWNVKVNKEIPKAFNGSAIKLAKVPRFLEGLTNTDFFWRSLGLGFSGENAYAIKGKDLMLDPLGSAEIWGEEALLYPRFLAVRNNILFSELNLAPTALAAKPLCERIVTTIFANAGVRVSPCKPVTLPKAFTYEPVDISKLLHRPLADEVDNDGKGGWADLGPTQDLREFKLPAGVHNLGGVDYRIERPNTIFVMKSMYRKKGDAREDVTLELGGKKAPWVFFLHSCVWEMAMQMMSVYVDYADGSAYEIVMSGGVNIRDYASRKPDKPFVGEIDTVTKCAVTVPQAKWGKGSLFSTGWCNPQPDKPIARLRFHSLDRGVVMFLAVTLGYPCAEVEKAGGGGERGGAAAAIDEKAGRKFADAAAKLQAAKKYREAIALYEKAHAADPRQLYVMNAIGNCYDRLEEFEKAYEWYVKSLDTDYNQPHVWAYRDAAKQVGGQSKCP